MFLSFIICVLQLTIMLVVMWGYFSLKVRVALAVITVFLTIANFIKYKYGK